MKTLLLILALSCAGFGQTKKPIVKPKVEPSAVAPVAAQVKPFQQVVVEKVNGDRLTGLFVSGNVQSVIIEISGANLKIGLSEINNLRFGELKESVAQVVIAKPSLSFEAALIYNVGGAQAVARTDFALLDKPLDDILREAGLSSSDGLSLANTFGFAIKGDGLADKYTNFAIKAAAAIKPRIKYETMTDFTGKGKFTDVETGKYWIFGFTQTRKGFAVWSLPVEVKNGENQVALDQSNAAGAF